MTKLDFAHNELTGTIPPRLLTSFGNHLEKLYLIDNKLVGSIPTEVGHLKSMIELTFAQNYLSGKQHVFHMKLYDEFCCYPIRTVLLFL